MNKARFNMIIDYVLSMIKCGRTNDRVIQDAQDKYSMSDKEVSFIMDVLS